MEKKTGAKNISKWSMIVAFLWIFTLSLTKAFWSLFGQGEFGLAMGDIIFSGLSLAGLFSPIYLSIFLDKLKEMKIESVK